MRDSVIGGRYRLAEPLGGTMSEVYLAEDTELGRAVVVKLLGREAEPARFEREARAAASLAHENIVRIYAYGEAEDGRPYMVLEHLPGGTLEERLGDAPLDDDETLRIARDVASGLAHAHRHGLVHRDLKPANILFDAEGRAKIADFGIARLGSAGTLTQAGTVLGTAAYISPEQGAGAPATPASDVYSLGVILYRMLTGRPPFSSQQPLELVRMHQTDTPRSVSDLRPDSPRRLESLVTAALAKDPAERPPDGAAVLAELGRTQGEPTEVLRPRPRTRPSRRRRPAPVLLAALFALLALAGAAAAVLLTREDSPAAPRVTTAASTTLPTASVAAHTQAPPPETKTEATTTARTTRAHTTTATPAPPPPPPATTILTEPETLPTIAPTTAPTVTIPPADG